MYLQDIMDQISFYAVNSIEARRSLREVDKNEQIGFYGHPLST